MGWVTDVRFALAVLRNRPMVPLLTAGLLALSVGLAGGLWTVVAVVPRSFKTIGKSDVWLPRIMTEPERAERRFHMVGVMARLDAGFGPVDAERELQPMYRQLAADHPDTTDRWTARVVPLRELMLGDWRGALQAPGAAVVALLAVAGINLVGLTLAWVRARRPELMVRMAPGASAGRVGRQVVAEAGVWALAGIAGGVWLAGVFVQLFGAVGVSPSLEYDFEPQIDFRVVCAMASLLGLPALVTTVVPTWLATERAGHLVISRVPLRGAGGRDWP